MEIIDVGEVAVEKVIDFILSKDNLSKLIRGNSVPSFVLAHQMIVPNLYKELIENSDTIDATTRDFIDFIVFYGNNASIVEEKNDGRYRRGESRKINGLSISKDYSAIYLDEGIKFSDCLSKFVKYDTENVNVRHLSNHMTRGALTLMEKYAIDENKIPSLLFINPQNIKEFFLAEINRQTPIAYIYEKILKPLSICFHEIEEFHSNTSKLNYLGQELKESKSLIETSPAKIEKLEEELSVLTEKLSNDKKEDEAKINLLEKKKQEYLNIKKSIKLDNLNPLPEGLNFSITQKLKEVQELIKEKEDFDMGKIIFKSTGHENLLREKNNKRLLKAKNNFESYINQIAKEPDQEINRIKNVIAWGNNRVSSLNYEINQTKSRYSSASKFISEFNSSTLEGLQNKISTQADKLTSSGLREFISEYSQDTFQIIRHILLSTTITNDMEKIIKRDVFICHSSEDKNPYVTELYESLELNGIKCWFDKNEIRWGDSIVSKVNEGLRISKYVLVVLSKNSINKNWPKAELEASLNLEFSTGNTRVLPLLLGNEMEIKEILEYYPILSSKLFVKYSNGMDKIIELIKDRLS